MDPSQSWNDRLTVLFRSHRGALIRFLGRHASNKNDVPDLVQDVYVKLTTSSIPPELEKPESYVISVARSILIDHHRRSQVRQIDEHGPLTDDLACTDFTPERVIDSKMAAQQLRTALLELPDRTQEVFALRTLQGMRMAEVAALMGISLSTAEKHHARALGQLAARLEAFR